MAELIADFAGAQREFHLRLGEMIDVEDACGGVPIATLYKRFATTEFKVMDVFHVLKQGLVGGGMPLAEADQLVRKQISVKPLFVLSAVASQVIMAVMAGIEASEDIDDLGEDRLIDKGALFRALVQIGVSPVEARKIRYADYVALIRAASDDEAKPPSEAEFDAMIRDWEERSGVKNEH